LSLRHGLGRHRVTEVDADGTTRIDSLLLWLRSRQAHATTATRSTGSYCCGQRACTHPQTASTTASSTYTTASTSTCTTTTTVGACACSSDWRHREVFQRHDGVQCRSQSTVRALSSILKRNKRRVQR
jgi:hypothetical protein